MDHGVDNDSRTWGMLCHLSTFLGYFFPFGHIIGPLICWLSKKEDKPFVDYHGKEALNFQISLTLYYFISGILVLVFVGIVLIFVIWIASLILTIIAAVNANKGEYYQYPLTIRFIK
jgi:uncharacterized Tic20 family protein